MPTHPTKSRSCVAPSSAGALPERALFTRKRKSSPTAERPTTLSSKSSMLHETLRSLVDQVSRPAPDQPSSSKSLRPSPPHQRVSVCRSFSSKAARRTDAKRRQPSPPVAALPSQAPINVFVNFPATAPSPSKSPLPSDNGGPSPASTAPAPPRRTTNHRPPTLADNDLRSSLNRRAASSPAGPAPSSARPPSPPADEGILGPRPQLVSQAARRATASPLRAAAVLPSSARAAVTPPIFGPAQTGANKALPAASSAIGAPGKPTTSQLRRIRRHRLEAQRAQNGHYSPLPFDVLPAHYEPPRRPAGGAAGPVAGPPPASSAPSSSAVPGLPLQLGHPGHPCALGCPPGGCCSTA